MNDSKSRKPTTNSVVVLKGLEASNPLAFLAAIGTLKLASLQWSDACAKLSWILNEGQWVPQLHFNQEMKPRTLAEGLSEATQSSSNHSALHIADDLTFTTKDYRHELLTTIASVALENRNHADFLAAFGSEIIETKLNGKPTGKITDTAFRTMSGAGHQHFLKTMRTLIADTTPDHIEKTLSATWRYDDPLEKHSLRWDPEDDIRYALRWDKPSGDKQRKLQGGMWGANCLALFALPLFPSQPVGNRLETTGFTSASRQSPQFTWPIWDAAVNTDTVRSLLSLESLHHPIIDRNSLSQRGIIEIYRCPRITQGKFRNFSQAQPV